jgi:putative nucleotidyltransferase with HDIG domain
MIISTAYFPNQEMHQRQCNKEDVKLLFLQALTPPTSSLLVDKILKATGDGSLDPEIMAEVISRNRSLSGRILGIANSTCFGLSQQVPTVPRAILVLGFEAVRSLVLTASIMETLANRVENGHFDRDRFWAHSLACAYLSKKIACMTHRAELETAFVSGILHDIGKIAMDFCFPESYRLVLARLADGMLTSVEAEDEILGFTHAEVGTWLAQQWRFPKAVIFTIANHHGTIADDSRYKSLASATRLANHLCSEEGICLAKKILIRPLENSIMEDLKLNQDDLRELRQALAAQKEAFASLVSR